MVKESTCQAGDTGLIPGPGRSPGEGNRNPLQYPCLGNPMDRGAWLATVHGAAKSLTWLSDFTFFLSFFLLLLVFSLILTVASSFLHLLSKTMVCLSGCLMSSATIQKLFCGICSVFKCSFNEFVGEKVVSLSYSSAILGPPPTMGFHKSIRQHRHFLVS